MSLFSKLFKNKNKSQGASLREHDKAKFCVQEKQYTMAAKLYGVCADIIRQQYGPTDKAVTNLTKLKQRYEKKARDVKT